MPVNCGALQKGYWRLHINPMNDNINTIKEQALEDYSKKRYQQAIEGFAQCLQAFQIDGDELSAAEMQNNLCVTYVQMKNGAEALAAVQDTDKVFAAHGDLKKQAMALSNTASALELLHQNDEALDLYQHALDLFKEVGEKEMRTSVLRRVADLQLKTKRELQAMASMEALYNQEEKSSIKDSFFRKILEKFRKAILKQN